jgi:predicted phosphodiesterase
LPRKKYEYKESELRALLGKHHGNITYMAKALGIGRRNLSALLVRHDINKNDYTGTTPLRDAMGPVTNERIDEIAAERDEYKRKYEIAIRKEPVVKKVHGKGLGGKIVDKILICPDTHSQFCDESALQVLLDFRDDWKPTKTVHLGDLVDCEAISSFPSDNAMPLDEEFAIAEDHLDRIRPTHYLQGNHEERIERPGLVNKSIRNLLAVDRNLHLEARGIAWKPYGPMEWFEFGKMKMMHGNYCGEYAAKQHAMAYGCVCFGHTHRIAQHTTKDITHRTTGFNIGTMTQVMLDYAKTPTGHTQGFAFMYQYANGDFSFYQVRLIGNEFVINDKHYERGTP